MSVLINTAAYNGGKTLMNIWKLMLHHVGEDYDRNTHPEIRKYMLEWSLENKHIALGWGKVSDIPKCTSPEKCIQLIKTEINNKYGDTIPAQTKTHGAKSLHSLCHVMQKDDLVIVVGNNSRREAIMRIGDEDGQGGEYSRQPEIKPPFHDYQHQRMGIKVGDDREAETLWQEWQKYGLGLENGPHCTLVRLIFPAEYRFP